MLSEVRASQALGRAAQPCFHDQLPQLAHRDRLQAHEDAGSASPSAYPRPAVGEGVCQIQVSHSDRAALEELIDELLQRRLIACGQVLGPISSRYRWEGRVEHEQEWLGLLKTAAARAARGGVAARRAAPLRGPGDRRHGGGRADTSRTCAGCSNRPAAVRRARPPGRRGPPRSHGRLRACARHLE